MTELQHNREHKIKVTELRLPGESLIIVHSLFHRNLVTLAISKRETLLHRKKCVDDDGGNFFLILTLFALRCHCQRLKRKYKIQLNDWSLIKKKNTHIL